MSKEQLEDIKNNKTYLEGTNELIIAINTDDYDWLIEQAELVQELKEKHKEYVSFVESNNYNMDVEMEKLYKQNKRYREALEFYANEENYFFDEKEYKVGLGVPESEITLDYGNKARKALKGE